MKKWIVKQKASYPKEVEKKKIIRGGTEGGEAQDIKGRNQYQIY